MTPHRSFFSIQPEKEFWVDIYRLMNSIVQPRPIAWISSLSAAGVRNLAPFSYFNICSMNPPIISNSIFFNRDGSEKDTLRNIKATRHYVVGTVSFDNAEKANLSSAPYDPDISEFDEVGISVVERGPGKPPFIADSPVQLVCELNQALALGEGAGVGNLVLGDVREIWITDQYQNIDWKQGLSPELLDNVGRMGADLYSRTSDRFSLVRATVPK